MMAISKNQPAEDEIPEPPSERVRVEAWRQQVLMDEAGFPAALAWKLSVRQDIDLHKAVEMVAHGCTPRLTARILL